ncbi:ABC transporter permease subunit [Falsibacillus pallidus]|uniref:ABC transporter permease subunit n=1 Tax=Falsibacillus pallidus TaxID=493781 RepID=UPI003D99249C
MIYLKKIGVQLLLWLVTTCLFLLIIFMPAEAVYKTGQGEQFISAEYHYTIAQHIQNIENFFQYIIEHKGLGDYNPSETLFHHISDKVKKSMLVVIPALIAGYFLGVAKGVLDFRLKGKKKGFLGNGTTWFFLSLPDLFVIIFLQIGLMYLYSKGLFFHVDLFGSDKVENYIMASIFLAIYPIFYIANITNTSLSDEQGMDYIRTAKSKGISSTKILYVHILKNSASKILAHSNTITLYVLSNLFIVERLTDFRGAAYYFFESVNRGSSFHVGGSMEVNVISAVGFTLFFTIIIFLSNLIAQLCRAMVDPVEEKGESI